MKLTGLAGILPVGLLLLLSLVVLCQVGSVPPTTTAGFAAGCLAVLGATVSLAAISVLGSERR